MRCRAATIENATTTRTTKTTIRGSFLVASQQAIATTMTIANATFPGYARRICDGRGQPIVAGANPAALVAFSTDVEGSALAIPSASAIHVAAAVETMYGSDPCPTARAPRFGVHDIGAAIVPASRYGHGARYEPARASNATGMSARSRSSRC